MLINKKGIILLFCKYLFYIAFCVYPNFSLAQPTKNNTIIWIESKHLTFNDFKVVPDHTKIVEKNVAALTRTGITYLISNTRNKDYATVQVSIRATFYKENSLIKEKVKHLPANRVEQLLNHEQRHFDISEIFARRTAKDLQTFRLSKNYHKEIYLFVNNIFKETEAWQHLYDKETENGENNETQALWNKKIEKELSNLESYKTKVVVRKIYL